MSEMPAYKLLKQAANNLNIKNEKQARSYLKSLKIITAKGNITNTYKRKSLYIHITNAKNGVDFSL